MDCQELKKRYDACKADRTNIQNVWEDIEQYVLPYRGQFFTQQNSELAINWRQQEIFDSTAIDAVQTLSASIHGALTSFVNQWFTFRWRDPRLKDQIEAQQWLEAAALKVYQALQESDFSLEVSEMYLDLTGYGTATITLEEMQTAGGRYKGLDFQSIPLKHAFFEVDRYGRALYFYKRLQWTPVQIVNKFGVDNVPLAIKEKAENAEASKQTIEVVFAVYPRSEMGEIETYKSMPALARPFGFKYFLYETAEILGEEGGYYEMPAYVPRWRKVNDSIWGHSPAMVQLSNIKTLNKLVELTLGALGKVVDPATIVTERGLISDLDLASGGLTVVRNKDDLWAYESKARFDAGDLKITDLRSTIQKAFFVDQLQLRESPQMSATEANIRYELMQRLLGPTLGRLQSDFFDPMLERVFKILYRAKQIEPPPGVIKDFDPNMDIDYLGPLPKAQRQQTAMAVDNFITQLEQLGGVHPEVLEAVDFDQLVKGSAELKGVPSIMLKTDRRRRAEMRKKRQQMEMAQQLTQEGARGEVMQSVGKGMQAMNEAQSGGTEDAAAIAAAPAQ